MLPSGLSKELLRQRSHTNGHATDDARSLDDGAAASTNNTVRLLVAERAPGEAVRLTLDPSAVHVSSSTLHHNPAAGHTPMNNIHSAIVPPPEAPPTKGSWQGTLL